jgi:hypothetical protein
MILAGIVVIAAFPYRVSADDEKAKAQRHEGHNAAFEKCAAECYACRRECESCSAHCVRLLAAGKTEHVKTLQTCRDCGDMCACAVGIISRHGPFADLICNACAEACARCEKACDRFTEEKHMKACAEECSRCEKACQEMLRHAKRSE